MSLRPFTAHLATETRIRLRSPTTFVALLAMFGLAYFFLPDPSSNHTSISWASANGTRVSGEYTASYVGLVLTMLTATTLPLIGFYLINGSIRRDRQSGVFPLLAASPISTAAYLGSKILANSTYLTLVGALMTVPGLALFFLHGSGPFEVEPFVLPWLMIIPPLTLFVAALTLLFEVTPLLRGKAGLVIWFFVFAFLFMYIPIESSKRAIVASGPDAIAIFDPMGIGQLQRMVEKAQPQSATSGLSFGFIILDRPIERVKIDLPPVTMARLVRGWATAAWSLLPAAAAALLFRRTSSHAPTRTKEQKKGRDGAAGSAGVGSIEVPSVSSLRPTHGVPTFTRAAWAEAHLVWQEAPRLRWALMASAVGSAVVSGEASIMMMAAFFLLLAIAIGGAASREAEDGTESWMSSLPIAGRGGVLWKLSGVGMFSLAVAAPPILRALVSDAPKGAALILGCVLLSAAAVAFGTATRSSKLFLGAFTTIWYIAIQGKGSLDFAGAFGAPNRLSDRLPYLVTAVVLVASAIAVERARSMRSGGAMIR